MLFHNVKVIHMLFRTQFGDLNKPRRQWHPTPVLLPGKSHGQRNVVGCSPWGRKESDTTKQLHFHFSLSCTGEGNGNPLQCSCLENPRDGGAWWAAIYGVAQSRTQMMRFSSSSSSFHQSIFSIPYLLSFFQTSLTFYSISWYTAGSKIELETRRSSVHSC